METGFQNVTALSTPDDQVNDLICQVADEHQLNLSQQISVKTGALKGDKAQQVQVDDLLSKFEELKKSKLAA